jgi:GNAT superfamily N-acetyltransferase
VTIRRGEADDAAFLEEMLLHAAYPPDVARPSREAMLADSQVARYVAGWGRTRDAGVVAVAGDGARVGAAWYRLFSDEEQGFGFVDATTPEVSIAVVPERRGQGIGSALLGALIEYAREDGHPALSLSVNPANRAAGLYVRFGFARVSSRDEQWTMRLALEPRSR